MPKSKPTSRGESAKPLEVAWTANAKEDLAHWQRHDPRIAKKIDELIANALKHPFTGLGKPEPLKHELAGYWSRRISGEHRLIYRVEAGVLYIGKCRFHYTAKKKK
ncbi:MAG: Txe/YoeB family addiction module toxin [Casimicrobiaceae bacterium]